MELARKLLANLFPSRCLFCQKTVTQHMEICQACYSTLPHNEVCCVRCALPLAETGHHSNVLCGRCIQKLPAYDYAHSLFRYEGDVVGLVHQLKFGEKIGSSRSIGELLRLKLDEVGEVPDCLLPVPLHGSRLRQRGYNQSIEIARVIAKKFSLTIEYDAVVRVRSTVAQTGLSAKQRQKNIKGAFGMVKKLAYKHVLIIDDVMTTGATVNELAQLLKHNGIERVGVLTIARAPVKN